MPDDLFTDRELTPVDVAVARKNELDAQRAEALSAQQMMFVNHLFECNMDVTIASERAAVKLKNAKDWVEKEGPVSEYIAVRLNEMAAAVNLKVEDIVKGLLDEAQRLPSGPGDKTVSHAARVSAWGQLAKYKGMMDKGSSGNSRRVSVNINIGGDVGSIEGEDDGDS